MKIKLWALFSLLFFAGIGFAQDNIDIKLSGTYAITDAHITQMPGKTIEKGTIVITDGIITDVGTNITIPPDAIIVKADSMYVYPGFIDAYNSTGVKKEERRRDEPRVANPGNPPNDRAGIMPDRTLADVYDHNEKSILDWREVGFTASLSAPSDAMLPGQTSLLMHSGKDASQAILLANNGQLGTFQNARRMYPATIIGVMAKYRDLMRQTSYAMKHMESYEANPVGMTRPSYDKSLLALRPIVDKSQYLFFEAEKYKDVSRAMVLQNDLDFKMALVNLKQGTPYIDQIKKQAIPVVLSMEVPEGEKKDKKEKKEDEGDEEKTDTEEDPEMEALKARKEEAIKEYQAQAAMFAKNDVAFGLSGKDVKPKDVKKNAKLMMEHGLTEDQMLAALTTNPAAMLGVSNILGSIEKGKIANLVITTAPYFEDDANVKYVYVEGEQFEYEVKAKKDKKEGAEGDLSGLYDCVLEVPGDERDMQINIKKNGDSYSVGVTNDRETEEIEDAEVSGNQVTFPLPVEEQGMTLNLKFTFTIDNGKLSGSVDTGQFGAFPIKGDRMGDPKSK